MKQNARSSQTSVTAKGKGPKSALVVSPPPLPDDCVLSADQSTFASPPPVHRNAPGAASFAMRDETDVGTRRRLSGRGPRWNVRSTSWLSSIVVHVAGLLLLVLILAPADFGGTGLESFTITLRDEVRTDEIAMLETIQVDADLASTLDDSSSSRSNSLRVQLVGSQGEAFTGKATRGTLGSASGSFFGIEAGGHQFVYVLDMSGSMKGRRFDRATAELVRSVEQLGPHQSFYVLLFSSGTTQMFGSSEFLPKPIVATEENKARLADWLLTAFEGGGTDPREALRIAMTMNPSAIFMLSDGQFNGRKNQKMEKLLGGNADAFSIVAAASAQTPIHAIAFEDKSSRENMKRLAEMTRGEYRFVADDDGGDPVVALKNARQAMQQGDHASGKMFLHLAIASLEGEEDNQARQIKVEVGEVLRGLAERGLKQGELRTARMALSEIVHMDARATVTDEIQTWLVDELMNSLQDNGRQKDVGETFSLLSKILQQSPRSAAAQKIRDPLSQVHLNDARQLYEKGDFLQAIRNLEIVMKTLPATSALPDCEAEHLRIGDELIQQAEQLRQEKGDAAAVLHLRQLNADVADTLLKERVTEVLEDQAREMLVAARDASIKRDQAKLNEIQQQLEEGFDEDPLLKRIQVGIALEERRAQAIMQTAMRLERSSRMAAMGKYRMLIQQFPGTLAAQRAAERLRAFGW